MSAGPTEWSDMTDGNNGYDKYHCPKHNKTICYFIANGAFKGFHCWDCNYESNVQEGDIEVVRHIEERIEP